MTAQVQTFLKGIARQIIPLHWRRAFGDKRQWFSRRQHADLSSVPLPPLYDARRSDIFVFAGPNPQALAPSCFPYEQRIFNFSLSNAQGDSFSALTISPDGRILTLSVPLDPASGAIRADAFAYLQLLIHEQSVEEAVCFVQHPAWERIATDWRNRYGWKLVLDRSACALPSAADGAQPETWQRLNAISDLSISPSEIAQPSLYTERWEQVERLYGKVSIIIVSYNGLPLIQQCVKSILQRTLYPNYEVIIVDNNSSDDVKVYLTELQQCESNVKAIFNDNNKGFAAANNIGLQHAESSEFVVLLNNDTVVPRGWLCRLLRYVKQPTIGLVGPVTNWTGNEARISVPYTAIADMETFSRTWTHANEGKFFDIRVAAMFCVGMRKSIVDQVGLLDERFGMGMFEDEDYARRVRQAGYRVICAEDVFVHHHGMASFSKLKDAEYRLLFEANKRRYEEKWGESWTPYLARAPHSNG